MSNRKPSSTEIANNPVAIKAAKIPTSRDCSGKTAEFIKAFIVNDDIRACQDLVLLHMKEGQAACEKELMQFIQENNIVAWIHPPTWKEQPSSYWAPDRMHVLVATATGDGPAFNQMPLLREDGDAATH